MSGVVLRCPQCGTVQRDSGECEACHEADVRYFCTNHTPGQWLVTSMTMVPATPPASAEKRT